MVLGREAGEEALQAFREKNGLNDPLPLQYGRWLGRFVTGNWGKSLSTRSDIFPVVMERLSNSLVLAALTLLLSVPLAVLLGVVAGLNENKLADTVISISALAVVGLPEFVTGLILIQIFARQFHLLSANASIRPDIPPSLIIQQG